MRALILARGGSKGVPGKNIKLLNGIPLIAYPILAAQKLKEITEIFVSTDSNVIANIAEEYGAEVIERPLELAQDTSKDIDSFIHAVKTKKWPLSEPIIHLRATTPLIKPELLSRAISLFSCYSSKCSSLRSAHKYPESIFKFFKKDDIYWTGMFPELKEEEYYNNPRQSFEENYIPNGYIDIVKPQVFMLGKTFHGNKILAFETPYVTELDAEEDFKKLEYEIKNYVI